MNKEILIAYVYSYLSYLCREENVKSKIKKIYLFGSVARNDFDEESDIDIFIDVNSEDEVIVNKSSQKALGKFLNIESEKWRQRSIEKKINLKVGVLKEWELKSSIEKEGIVLYASAYSSGGRKFLLFSYGPIVSSKQRVKIGRLLFGRGEATFKSKGLVQLNGGKVVGPRVFLIPAELQNKVASVFSKEKINFQFEEVWM